MRKIIVTTEIWKEGDMFTAYCPELDVASCGHSSDGVKKNLNEVIECAEQNSYSHSSVENPGLRGKVSPHLWVSPVLWFRDTVTIECELVEDTYDWYAQDKEGNVWYMGEDSKEYENGKVVSTAGFLLMRRYGNRVMMNCCHLWWTCGPYKVYAAELMADFLREHQNEREIARGRLSEHGLSWG